MTDTRPRDETICLSCPHPFYDHGGWMSPERYQQVMKTRQVGCRVSRCYCPGWSTTTVVISKVWEGVDWD